MFDRLHGQIMTALFNAFEPPSSMLATKEPGDNLLQSSGNRHSLRPREAPRSAATFLPLKSNSATVKTPGAAGERLITMRFFDRS